MKLIAWEVSENVKPLYLGRMADNTIGPRRGSGFSSVRNHRRWFEPVGEPSLDWVPPDTPTVDNLGHTSLTVWRTSADILGQPSEETFEKTEVPVVKVDVPPDDAAKTKGKPLSRLGSIRGRLSPSSRTSEPDVVQSVSESAQVEHISMTQDIQELPGDCLLEPNAGGTLHRVDEGLPVRSPSPTSRVDEGPPGPIEASARDADSSFQDIIPDLEYTFSGTSEPRSRSPGLVERTLSKLHRSTSGRSV